MYGTKVVKKRNSTTCNTCGELVPAGSIALTKSTKQFRGGWNSQTHCKECALKFWPQYKTDFYNKENPKPKPLKESEKPSSAGADWFDGGE